jgi:hypothetical protein
MGTESVSRAAREFLKSLTPPLLLGLYRKLRAAEPVIVSPPAAPSRDSVGEMGQMQQDFVGLTNCLFIIGCPRSGTSALAWALAQHPQLWTSAETNFLHHLFGARKLYQTFESAHSTGVGWLRVNGVTYAEFAGFLGLGIDQLFLSRSAGKRWIDQSPANTLCAMDLCYMFPNGQFIHLIRDGREVVNSMLNTGFQWDWARDFETACSTWIHYVEVGLKFQQSLPERTLQVRHDHLVLDPDIECERILRFLGVDHSDEPAKFLKENRINSSYGNQKPADMLVPKDTSGLKEKKWKSWTPKRKKRFIKIAGPTMLGLGFDIERM